MATEYANDVLVTADWADQRLEEFQSDDSDLRLVEVDVDTEAYDEEHAPVRSGSTGRPSSRTRPLVISSRRGLRGAAR